MLPAPTDGASRARIRFGRVRIGGVALAVAALAAFAGTGTGSASAATTPGATTVPGAVGSIPAAGTPSGTAGSITYNRDSKDPAIGWHWEAGNRVCHQDCENPEIPGSGYTCSNVVWLGMPTRKCMRSN